MKSNLISYPQSVKIDGREYVVNTDFSVWIEIEQQFLKAQKGVGGGLARALALAFPVLPENFGDAVGGLMWFYSEGTDGQGMNSGDRAAPAYDLKEDFEYIRAGFLSEFGIDLMECDMHWWQFRRLLSCLGESCRFMQIVAYRRADISKIKDRELRSFYQRMKKRYRLPDIRTEEEKETELAQKIENIF